MTEQTNLPVQVTPEMRKKFSAALDALSKGGGTLDLLWEALDTADILSVTKPDISVPKISEEALDAIRRLPEVYGKVVPKTDRALNKTELAAIVEERQIIDTVLKVIKARKDESIRETLANHLDNVYEAPEGQRVPTDSKGHLAVKQEVEVEGAGKKVARSVSGGKPYLSIAGVEALHAEGRIDRKTYLKITKKTEVPRVLDQEGLVKAMKEDPNLGFLLAQATEHTSVTTSITVK